MLPLAALLTGTQGGIAADDLRELQKQKLRSTLKALCIFFQTPVSFSLFLSVFHVLIVSMENANTSGGCDRSAQKSPWFCWETLISTAEFSISLSRLQAACEDITVDDATV